MSTSRNSRLPEGVPSTSGSGGSKSEMARDEVQNNHEPRVAMLVSNPFHPDPRVFREARSLVKNGISVEVFAWDRLRKFPKEETVDGIQIHRIQVASEYGKAGVLVRTLPLFWLSCFRILLRSRVRVIHCHDFDTLPVGALVKLFKRNAVIFDAHEFYPGMASEKVPGAARAALRMLHSVLPGTADAVFVASDQLRPFFRHKNLVVIPNYPPLSETDINLGGRADKSFRIFFFGGLAEDQGIVELLEIADKAPNARVVIAGDGPLRERVEKAARENSRVEYLGWITPARMEGILPTMDYSALLYKPTKYHVLASPNRLFQSLKFGVIPVLNEGTAMAKVAKEEGFGLVVPLGDATEAAMALMRLQDDEEEKVNLRLRGRNAFLRKYNWSIGESRLLATYGRLMGEHP